jgi:hypothetical protein
MLHVMRTTPPEFGRLNLHAIGVDDGAYPEPDCVCVARLEQHNRSQSLMLRAMSQGFDTGATPCAQVS